MNIVFSSTKQEKIFNSQKLVQKAFGEQAGKIMTRMGMLRSAPNLASVPSLKPDRRHELRGNRQGTFAVDLKQPFRLIFEPAEAPAPKKTDGGIDLEKVISIRILSVEDYH